MSYLRAETLEQVFPELARGARVIAGGTDMFPGQGARLSGPVVDISRVSTLRGISAVPTGLRIGAATRWSDIAEADLPPAFQALQEAARQVGGRQVQNVGTIGGNLCNASPAADGVPPLLVLDANVEVVSAMGNRHIPLGEFLRGPRKVDLRPGEVLAALHVPGSSMSGRSTFLKLGARAYLVISIAMVAVRLHILGHSVTGAAVAVGACGPVARRLPAVELALTGLVTGAATRARDADFTGLEPIDDVRASAAYRREVAAELVARAVERIVEETS